jgi:mannose-6-phosphate isomerase-like protein (cupin superfamily)
MRAETGRTYENPRSGARLTVLTHWEDGDGERLEFERELPPRTGKAPPHVHLDFTQTFAIRSGRARAAVGKAERSLTAGDELRLPPGARHVDPWNDGAEPLVYRVTVGPVPEFIRAYAEVYLEQLLAGRLNRQDELHPLQIAVLAQATDAQSFDVRLPRALQQRLLPLFAALGRLRGYRPRAAG